MNKPLSGRSGLRPWDVASSAAMPHRVFEDARARRLRRAFSGTFAAERRRHTQEVPLKASLTVITLCLSLILLSSPALAETLQGVVEVQEDGSVRLRSAGTTYALKDRKFSGKLGDEDFMIAFRRLEGWTVQVEGTALFRGDSGPQFFVDEDKVQISGRVAIARRWRVSRSFPRRESWTHTTYRIKQGNRSLGIIGAGWEDLGDHVGTDVWVRGGLLDLAPYFNLAVRELGTTNDGVNVSRNGSTRPAPDVGARAAANGARGAGTPR